MYTVITKGNEVSQCNSIDGVNRDIKHSCIVVNKIGTIIERSSGDSGDPITWPADATDGLQAIVDVKAGTLRFAYDGGPRAQTEFVVSEYVEGCAPIIGTKHDHGKPILGAVPPHAELAVGRVLTFGAEKYARGNWDKVEDHENRYMDAALRHLNAHRRGELTDSESGESHLAHAACCILFMLDKQERGNRS